VIWFALRRFLGFLLLMIGIVILVTPFTPGSLLFLVVGAELSGLNFLIPKKIREKWYAKAKNIIKRKEKESTKKD
jgi:hypothetical protein